MNHPRGIFERPKESGVWWIRYADAQSREHREKAGTKGMALALYRKRKTEALMGKKLPEKLRSRGVIFNQLADHVLEHSKSHKRSYRQDVQRMPLLREWFGPRDAASISPQEIEQKLAEATRERNWTPATSNRYRTLLSLVFSLAIRNGHLQTNPVRLVRALRENNCRVRYLTDEEEPRLRNVIEAGFPEHMAELDLALHTGMRLSEQFGLTWEQVNFERRLATIPRSKHGETRHVRLNSTALAALRQLKASGNGHASVILNQREQARQSPRNWFTKALAAARIENFTWHDLRHTFASRLVMAGVDLRTVQELMGHKTMDMTVRYAHLAPEHEQAAVERLVRKQPESAISTGTITGTDQKASKSIIMITSVNSVV